MSNPWRLHFHITFVLIENFVKIGAQLWIIKKLGCFDIKHTYVFNDGGSYKTISNCNIKSLAH